MLQFLLSLTNCEESAKKVTYLYTAFHDEMVALARSMLKERGDDNYDLNSEDIVQEAYLRLMKYINAVDFARTYEELHSYVTSTVINVINDHFKNGQEYELCEDIDMLEDCENRFFDQINAENRYENLMEAINRLDEIYLVTLKYRFIKGMSVEAISKLMGVPKKTVYTRLRRGRKMIIEYLEAKRND